MSNLVEWLRASPAIEDKDEARIAHLLNFILLSLLTGAATYIIFLLTLAPNRLHRWPVITAIFVLAAALKLLLHLRKTYLTSYILVTGLWVILTVATFSGGGVYNPGYAGFIGLVIAAALLLGARAAIAFGALSIATGLAAYYLDYLGIIAPPPEQPTAFTLWLIYSIIIAFAAATLYLAAHSIDSALQEARAKTEALKRSEAHYRTLMEQANDGIVITDMQGNLLDVNEKMCEMLGYARSELIGLNAADIISAESLAAMPIRLADLSAGQRLVMEREFQRKDGSTFPVESSACMIEGKRLLAIVRDITERKQAAEDLRQSEARYRLLAEHAMDMISRHTPKGIYLYASPACRYLTGYAPEELVGRDAYDLFHPEDVQRITISHKTILQSPVVYTVQYRIRRKDGTYLWVETISKTLRNPDTDEIEEIIAVTRDISRRKAAELERERLIEQLDKFAQTVAHDLKNPLNIILGYTEVLREDLSEPEVGYVEKVWWATQKMEQIIDELLRAAQMRNQNDVKFAPLTMETIVGEALERLGEMIAKREARLTLPDEWPAAVGYAPWVEEVWVNYLSNALKYGGDPPVIEVSTDASENGGMVRFWIRDNGPGLSPDEQEQLFQEFSRLIAERDDGHGLGLSIVKRLVDQMAGQTGVESKPGSGSCFWFTLPAPAGE